ncbi:helix-turn-helix domain-containing protein [Mammaliicoccus lentus]|uniref:helix-turn-helix domain-containing protein n=1 Tax=Mammaliicoccus lentus TaxID=42858 RepID=UPI002B2623A4|nr:helix-turn-helix transcriptional regulator [Mammaliicoccus lentus]WQK49202.1 helix-turn-helix transcriptional regulator [Mammaliicoccus lentus]
MEYKSARKILSENLQKLMKNNNVTQKELSEELGVSQSTISNWIKEVKYPRIDKVEMLAKYFNVPKSDITEQKEEKPYEPETIAFHLEGEFNDLDQDEMQKVLEYVKFLKSQHK